jgi:hypothetical protein
MADAIVNALLGPCYVFEPFENDVVSVYPVGPSIRVGIKDAKGTESKWFDLAHPFSPPPEDLATQEGWTCTFATEPAVQSIVFKKGRRRHTLTVIVMDPAAKPMSVRVLWE